MAARVLLLGILFTEVFRTACPTGVRVNGSGAKRSEALAESPGGGGGSSSLGLEIRPRGEIILGQKGVNLNCNGPASHGSEISWLYNGRACDAASHCNGQVIRNGVLRVKKKSIVQKRKGREGGNATLSFGNEAERNEYRCVARTSYGAYLRSAPTYVLYAELDHAFDESPEDLWLRENEIARLSCSIAGVPPPNITWLHNGEPLADDPDSNKYAFVSPGILYIRAVKPSDAGSYRCVAVNDYINVTKKSKEAKLSVVPRQEKQEDSPIAFYPQPSYRHTPLIGTNLRLACAASGHPTPELLWTFVPQQGPDFEGEQSRLLRSASSGLNVLELKNVSAADTGIYTCSARSANRSDHTITQNVSVEVLVPPSFVKRPANQVYPNGRTVRFECQAQGSPQPRIYWLKNAENITINGRRTIYDKEYNKMELAISATVPSDSGIYQCVAVNAAGEVWAAGRLQVNASRNSPAAPTSLQCEARSPVKIFISWVPPKFLPATSITAYTVHYRPVEGGKEEVSPPEPGNSTSVEVTKLLEPFTNYTFYVRLWNNHGPSDQSATITCSTNESVPKAAPKISVNVINSTKLNVTWKPLTKKEAQGIVTEYKLEWRLFQQPSVHIKSLTSDVRQYILSDLTPGEQYDVRVLARTQQGWPTNESQLGWVTVTMPSSNDLSQIQILILNSTTIKTKWNIKANSVLQFTSCKVICKNEDEETIGIANLTTNSTEHIFTNLNSTIYTFEICALNFGETLHCITKHVDLKRISMSNIPTALEAVPLSSTSISLTWFYGKSNESNLFEVCYHSVHVLNESLTCIPSNLTNIVINDLKPFMLYQFKVRVVANNSDDNSFSETIECYTNEDVPEKVRSIESFTINGSVMVSWKEPTHMNGIIQNYFVAYSSDQSEPRSRWKNITVLGNRTYTNIPGLEPGKKYFVIIQASNNAGFGNASEPVAILIGESSPEVHSSFDKKKSVFSLLSGTVGEDTLLGIYLGSGFALVCVIVCLWYLWHERRKNRSSTLCESTQPLRNGVLVQNGNGCCVDRSSTNIGHSGGINSDFELAVLYPTVPGNNPLCDTKGGQANGIVESCAKEPLLAPRGTNGFRKDLRITENPQEELPELNSTQLTTLNFDDMSGSDESFNNNVGHHGRRDGNLSGALPSRKVVTANVPVLEPNG